jgi:hypothetical protein
VLRVACCVLRVACCVLRVACCVLRVACCVLRVACCVLRVACCLAKRCLADRCSSCRIARTGREQNIAILSAVGDVSRSPMIKSALCTLTPAQAWAAISRRSGRSLVPLMPLTRSFHGSASVPSDDADAGADTGANTLLMKQHMHSLKVSYHTGVLCVCVRVCVMCACVCARACVQEASSFSQWISRPCTSLVSSPPSCPDLLSPSPILRVFVSKQQW